MKDFFDSHAYAREIALAISRIGAWEIYLQLGLKKGRNSKFFHCPFAKKHSGGVDNNPSLSINNETGQYLCFTCKERGNLQTYVPENTHYFSFADFATEVLGVNKDDYKKGGR